MEPAGTELIIDVVSAAGIPVVAIGGITAERVPEAMTAGASGVAVIREVLESPEPGQAAQQLRDAVKQAAEGALAS
jgi:thiamine-phosphate pyrophosphorylase